MSYVVEKVLATIAFAAAIVSEVNHTFIDKIPWNGFALFANNSSFILLPVWFLAIAGLWMQDRLYKFFQLAGVAMLCGHAMVLASGGNKNAVFFYFSLFVISAVCSLLIEWRDRYSYYA